MDSVQKAYETQVANIQKKTGKSLEELAAFINASGLTKHGEIRSYLMQELGLGHGDANTLVHVVKQSDGASAASAQGLSETDVLNDIYTGPKEWMRPIHEAIMEHVHDFGDFEIAPKKGYVSLRRKKQFAMLGPATNSRFEVGINHKGLDEDERLLVQKPGSMCNYVVRITSVSEVDETLIDWMRSAYDAAG